MKQLFLYISLLFLLVSSPINADHFIATHINMVRVKQGFPETMLRLQEVIKEHGYTLSRVQRVDIGLTGMGYSTDKYRVVFFAKHDEFRWLIKHHPEFIPYLPLKIAIYAEGKDTILVVYNPQVLFKPKNKEIQKIIARWGRDLTSMFKAMHDYSEQ